MAKRTEEHVIADLSLNFLEHLVLRRGHVLDRIGAGGDYGTDALMRPFSREAGRREGVFIGFQLKATNSVRFVENNTCAVCRVKAAHLQEWSFVEDYPFFLVLYDATKRRAFWLDIHAFVEAHGIVQEDADPETETLSLRIPVANKLTVRTIDMFYRMSLERKESFMHLRERD